MPKDEEELLENEEVVEETENTSDVQAENLQPADEDPASSIGSLVENEVKAKAKAEMSKKALALLLKNPMFWIVVGGAFIVIFVAILIFAMDFDLYGTGDVKPQYYDTICDKIYLTWEKDEYIEEQKKLGTYEPITDPSLVDLTDTDRFEYKEYDYDTYVSGIVWNDNKSFGDVNNDVVYEAMSIAARTRVVRNLNDNCVVLKDYNPENFVELTGQEDKYTEITEAVSRTKGIVIGIDGELIESEYDAFSYIKKKKENETGTYFYHMMNANEQGQQIIHASWVEENNITPKKVFFIKKFESMSAYGAKYLLEMQDSQYDLYRVLEFYYSRDLEYYTIDYAYSDEYNPSCSDINMKSTSLTKEEFIARVSTISNAKAKALIDNAGMIYDMGVNNGVNPELVYIRAYVEGYSPGESRNNYWGIGCTNTGGLEACHTYGSLSEGVAAFYKIASQYDTLADFAGRYAYLGDYWYNPGSAGIGGCYYAPYIFTEIPEHVKNACAAGKSCTTAGGGDCVATTEEDKYAYLVYQSQTMVKARKVIFGLDADSCETDTPVGEPGSGSCTIWKQSDSSWGSIKLGSSSLTMSNSGCAVTSIAIAMSCSGTTINSVASFNPGTLVRKLNAMNGFTQGGAIKWANGAIQYFAPNFRFGNSISLKSATVEAKLTAVNKALKENNGKAILLLHFVNDKHPRGHWVVLKSVSGSTFTVYDPAGNESNVNTYAAKDLDDIRVYYF